MSYTKIMPRRGTAYAWTTENPILAEGELGIEFPESGIGTGLCRVKIGDGFKRWNELAYALDGASASAIYGGDANTFNLILLRSDTEENWLAVNPVLTENEIVYCKDRQGFKIGDGVSHYNELGWVGRLYVYDFGDEDAPSNTSTASLEDKGSAVPLPGPTATLADMIGKVTGDVVTVNDIAKANEEPSEVVIDTKETGISFYEETPDEKSEKIKALEAKETRDIRSKNLSKAKKNETTEASKEVE